MNVILYTTGSEKNALRKSLNNATTFECYCLEATNILEPDIRIETGTMLSAFNYAYIPIWGRWYFIKSSDIERNGVWLVHLKVDVLETYAGGILALSCVIARQENSRTADLVDDRRAISSKNNYIQYGFGSGGSLEALNINPSLILLTTGPGGTSL